MGMGNSRNPSSNAILQACLDVKDAGYGGMTFDQMITRLSSDKRLAADLQAKWNAHAYPERAMTWAQLAKEQRLLTLSPDAIKVLTFYGMYCHQSTLLQVSYKDLSAATDIKDRSLRTAVKELIDAGCLRIERPSVRHAAPVYAVNPSIINKGTRRKSNASDFVGKMTACRDYILQRELPLVVQEQTIYEDTPDGGKIAYNRIALATPGEAAKMQQPKRRRKTDPGEQLPGQMSVFDIPEALP